MNDSAVTWHAKSDSVFVVTMALPPANALGLPIIDGLNAAFDAADKAGAKVVVLTSDLPGFFAAGADIKHMSTVDAESFLAYGNRLRAAANRIAEADRIVIAAVEGLALGGGLELAMACTMRVGGAAARFGLPEVKLGLIPGAGGTQRLPRLVGRGRALDLMLTGRQLSAEEAYRIGLLDRLAAEGNAQDVALQLADQLAALSLPAQLAVIRTVDASFDLPLVDGLGDEVSAIQELFETGEAREGISAFLQKRSPKFL